MISVRGVLMTDSRITTKINTQLSEAERALTALAEDSLSAKEKAELIATVRLVITVLEHKMLRIKELEATVKELRAQPRPPRHLNGDVELIQEIADLDRKIVEYQNTIAMLQELYSLPQTGT